MRMAVVFTKEAPVRFVSHLDVQRLFQRAFRRAKLPMAYSQGFNPHPQMSFASALAMGWSSDVELMDIRLTEAVDPGHALEQMRSVIKRLSEQYQQVRDGQN